MSDNTIQRILFLQKISRLLLYAESLGISVFCFYFHRTDEEQKSLYDKGLSKCDGIIKRSYHQDWRAWDIGIYKDGEFIRERIPEYEKLGQYWKEIGGDWGGDWESLNDIYHFQL